MQCGLKPRVKFHTWTYTLLAQSSLLLQTYSQVFRETTTLEVTVVIPKEKMINSKKSKEKKKKWNKNEIIPNEVLILELLTYLNYLNVTEYTIWDYMSHTICDCYFSFDFITITPTKRILLLTKPVSRTCFVCSDFLICLGKKPQYKLLLNSFKIGAISRHFIHLHSKKLVLLFWVSWVSLSQSERGEKALQYFNECGLNVMPHGLINIQCTSNTPFLFILCADMRVCPYVCVYACFVFLFNSTVPLCLDSHAGKKWQEDFILYLDFFFSDALILLPKFFYTLRNHWQEVLHILKLQLVVFELWTHQLWLFKHSI